MKSWYNFRGIIQPISTIFFNLPFLAPCLKQVPVPVLNCYACPLASGACPIGTLQHFAIIKKFPFYTIGILGIVGAISGRFSCGFLCPFGYLQDWLYKIKSIKIKFSYRHPFTRLKYLVLILLVFVIPYITNESWFSKLCPVGMLQAGIPLTIIDASLRALISRLFYIKIAIILTVLLGSVFVERFWCRILCPLGAIFSIFNPVSLLRLKVDCQVCTSCEECSQVCPIGIDVHNNPNSPECIRCFKCLSKCENISLVSLKNS